MKDNKSKKQKLFLAVVGLTCGLLNGFFGAGGGSIAVPLLKKAGLEEKTAHATSVAVILCTTIVSSAFYIARGSVSVSDSLPFIYTGVLGSAVGAFLLKKISGNWLRRIFGALIVITSIRMFLK